MILSTPSKPPNGDAAVSASNEQDPITDVLKKMYGGVEHEAVPDDFLNLLNKLDEADDTAPEGYDQ